MRPIGLLVLCAAAASAQDPFEIHVYEYEPLARGEFTYETHLNLRLEGDQDLRGSGCADAKPGALHFRSYGRPR